MKRREIQTFPTALAEFLHSFSPSPCVLYASGRECGDVVRNFVMALPVEARVARLEEMIKHLQSDISEIKADVRRLDEKIDRSNEKLIRKIENQKPTTRLCNLE